MLEDPGGQRVELGRSFELEVVARRRQRRYPPAACAGVVVECGGRSNCGEGQVCCLRLGNGPLGATCSAESDCKPSNNVAIFCRTNADCPSGQVCVKSTGSFAEHKVCF